MKRYTYTTSLNRGGDEPTWEGEVEVSFSVEPGEPESPPSYASGGTPASSPQIIDITLEKVDGKARPWGMYSGYIANEDDEFAREVVEELEGSDDHLSAMLMLAAEEDAAQADEDADRRYEERRDEALMNLGGGFDG